MPRPVPSLALAAVALLAPLGAVACANDADDAETPQAAPAETTSTQSAGGGGDGDDPQEVDGGEATFRIDGLTFRGTVDCGLATVPSGTTVEVTATGSTVGGDATAQIRVVHGPPGTGDASIRVTLVDRAEYVAQFRGTGEPMVEVDDLVLEVEDDRFYLVGTAELDDGTTVPVDLETDCERVS